MNVITYACWNLMYPHRELPIAWWRHGMETFGALGVHRLPKLWLSIHTGQLRNDHDVESNQVHLSFFSLSGKTSYSRDLVRASAVLLPRRLPNLKPLYIHIAKFRDFVRSGGETSYNITNIDAGSVLYRKRSKVKYSLIMACCSMEFKLCTYLTHWGLLAYTSEPYGVRYLGQHWFR